MWGAGRNRLTAHFRVDRRTDSVKKLTYAPYGYTGSHATMLGFNGQWGDPLAHLYPLGSGYRMYSPSIQRFLSADSHSPFGHGGLNAYAYCEGDPVNYTDPTGAMRRFPRQPASVRPTRRSPSPTRVQPLEGGSQAQAAGVTANRVPPSSAELSPEARSIYTSASTPYLETPYERLAQRNPAAYSEAVGHAKAVHNHSRAQLESKIKATAAELNNPGMDSGVVDTLVRETGELVDAERTALKVFSYLLVYEPRDAARNVRST
ncbi:RHS repeat-associated core domain-containing protein [Pseudomonas sp. NPDC008258]|uniref:RHS repeat-associated core domain-containing protein n=1 Tax=Pseudomonas sp. NPDC008258 TaxID=3364418 RepID=UPI0036E11E74